MSDRWTPGPWRADGPDMFGDYNILHPADGLAVAAAVGSAYPEEPRPVVVIPTNLRSPEEVGANARLISAAPDMAEALNSIARCLAPGHRTMDELIRDQDLACAIARAALAKARGQA